jgi:hypothetical protein
MASKLSEEIIERGPFKPGDVIPNLWRFPSTEQLNELRWDLINGQHALRDLKTLIESSAKLRDDRNIWRRRAIEAGWTDA